jgi:hypothetical protein
MSYRDPAQSVDDTCAAMATVLEENLPDLQSALTQRVISDEWKDEHIEELTTLAHDVLDLAVRLRRMSKDTW